MSTYDQIAELRSKANGLPHGPAQVALLEEAVRLADSMEDIDLAYAVRHDLMTSADFSGRPDQMIVAFSWCLAQFDRNPERFNRRGMLWKYKWVVDTSYKFPQISRTRIEHLLADMERRYREAGSTMHAASLLRRSLFLHFGEMDHARAAHAELLKLARDTLSDCRACVACADCRYYSRQHEWNQAIEAAQPVLQNRLTCKEEPHRILANVLRPLFHLGRLDEANQYHIQGYQLVRRANHFVSEHAEHLKFLVLIGDWSQAQRLLERHIAGALAAVELDECFQFLLAARLWTDRLLALGTNTMKLRLPPELPAADANSDSDLAALQEWLTARANEVAGRFDARNGTNAYQRQIDELPELLRAAVD